MANIRNNIVKQFGKTELKQNQRNRTQKAVQSFDRHFHFVQHKKIHLLTYFNLRYV